MPTRTHAAIVCVAIVCSLWLADLQAAEVVDHPFLGITHITRTETSPRNIRMHIVQIDLTVPKIQFELTPPNGSLETVRETTSDFLNREHGQVAINGHFFLPFPSTSADAMLIGLAASQGNVYSAFESPIQSYAIVTDAPTINIDFSNTASVVHRDPSFHDGKHVLENVTLWNAVSGSAQIVTNSVKTIPIYRDEQNPTGLLTPGGPANYSNANSWYELINARTAIGLSEDNRTLTLFTVDRASGSEGMSVGEVADLLIKDYGVYNAINLDGGGSTSLAMADPISLVGTLVNVSSDNPNGRSVGSNLAVFTERDDIPPSTAASLRPGSNKNGWNNTDVTLTLDATDNLGGRVKTIRYSAAGAYSVDSKDTGNSASSRLTAEGITKLMYFAEDYGGNVEVPQSLTIAIDKTAPVISGIPSHGCALSRSNLEWQQVATIRAADAVSGLEPGSFQVHVTSNQISQTDGSEIVVTPDGADAFKIYHRADRLNTGAGRLYTITATARDLASNVATATALCTVGHN